MKWFPFLWSLYILCLALVKCTDAQPAAITAGNIETIQAMGSQADHDHSHTSGTQDECSPLCTCHCCHIHVTLSDIIHNDDLVDDLSRNLSYLNQLKDLVNFDFFVPPRA